MGLGHNLTEVWIFPLDLRLVFPQGEHGLNGPPGQTGPPGPMVRHYRPTDINTSLIAGTSCEGNAIVHPGHPFKV